MFENFANIWTIVGLARDVPRHRPLAIKVAGERVVLFRNREGEARALIDQCPHRGAALSLGRVQDGVIECPFHGWRFDGDGRNCHVPWNPDAKREMLGATALPLREDAGLLWLFTGFAPTQAPQPSATFAAPGVRVCAQSVIWRAHWTRVMENMLDMPHLPFVHRRTIGAGLTGIVDRRMDIGWEERPYGARITSSVDGAPRPGALEFRFPNAMELFIDPPKKLFRLMAVCIPQGENETRLLLLTMRSFATLALLDPIFRLMNRRIAQEDRAIVESSLPAQVPPPSEEASVRTDAPTLAFRRVYRLRLLGSRAIVRQRSGIDPRPGIAEPGTRDS